MKPILILLLLFPLLSFSDDFELLCKGEETKYLDGDSSSKEVTTKVIGIQLYEESMRLDGEWFDNKSDLTEDYLLERSYVKSKDYINAARNFSTNALIEGRVIQLPIAGTPPLLLLPLLQLLQLLPPPALLPMLQRAQPFSSSRAVVGAPTVSTGLATCHCGRSHLRWEWMGVGRLH